MRADAEALPLADGSVGVVLSNGILNLNTRRDEILAEVARALRSGGRLYAAELVQRGPLGRAAPRSGTDWFA